MAVDRELARKTIDYLNRVLNADKEWLSRIVNYRLACEVECQEVMGTGGQNVGMLGLLNGLIGRYEDGPKEGWGAVGANVEDDGTLNGFFFVENTETMRVE